MKLKVIDETSKNKTREFVIGKGGQLKRKRKRQVQLGVQATDPGPSTFRGVATIGRDKNSFIYLPDLEASNQHAEIIWETVHWQNSFTLVDVGSTNGTFVNALRVTPKKVSNRKHPLPLNHGDEIRIGSFLLQVSCDYDATCNQQDDIEEITCGYCDFSEPFECGPLDGEDIESSQNKEKQKIRKKDQTFIKLSLTNYTPEEKQHLESLQNKYRDRAFERRSAPTDAIEPMPPHLQIAGNPPVVSASATTPISEMNVGNILLKKMGWKDGEGLGKFNSGIKEPLKIATNKMRSGLGF
eukprot:TRINITY_DN3248_c0_g1_i2.p1 TRINITY_DN3248_c0_g1~~TRINITY_DN3248_c0_g1_i2.p1  ORF type:complete len:297 (-),score=58.69 TRINITY_DN3248_c0_g1_i2:146-1036(-)